MLKDIKDKLETLATLLEKDIENKEAIIKNAEQHFGHFATAAQAWEREKEEAKVEHERRMEQAQKDKELLDTLLKK